jgi:antitoxin MazE
LGAMRSRCRLSYVRSLGIVRTRMVKKLTKTGNSFALVLEKPILEKMKIDADTPLEVSTNGEVIVISPVRDRRRVAKLRAIVERAHRDYSGVFARLAK